MKSKKIRQTCIYCKKGCTKKNPMLFRVYAPGEYWQHWSFNDIGCSKNIENVNPTGKPIKK